MSKVLANVHSYLHSSETEGGAPPLPGRQGWEFLGSELEFGHGAVRLLLQRMRCASWEGHCCLRPLCTDYTFGTRVPGPHHRPEAQTPKVLEGGEGDASRDMNPNPFRPSSSPAAGSIPPGIFSSLQPKSISTHSPCHLLYLSQ